MVIEESLIEAAKAELLKRGKDANEIAQIEEARKQDIAKRDAEWKEGTRQRYRQSKRHPLKLEYEQQGEKKVLTNKVTDPIENACRVFETTGLADMDGASRLISQVVNVQSDPNNLEGINASIAMLNGIHPQDPLEGLLAAQMVTVHNLSLEYARRAMGNNLSLDAANSLINRTAKLMNVFTRQIETLQKYRNKGQQKITVQHVQVGQGGQAIIGDVHQGKAQ